MSHGKDSVTVSSTSDIPKTTHDSRFTNSLAKLTLKTVLISTACIYAPTLIVTAYGIKTLIVGSLFLYSGAIDNLINCII